MPGRWTTVLQPWPAGSTENQLEYLQKMVCSEQPNATQASHNWRVRQASVEAEADVDGWTVQVGEGCLPGWGSVLPAVIFSSHL